MSKRKPPSGKLSDLEKKDWNDILEQVEKKEIPVELLDRVVVNFIDDSNIVIDIQKLLNNNVAPSDIEKLLEAKLSDMDDLIKDVDFHITKEKVISTISPFTKKILNKLK